MNMAKHRITNLICTLIKSASSCLLLATLACSHLPKGGKDPEASLLLKSGDQEPIMNAGLTQNEWNRISVKPKNNLEKTISEVATSNFGEAEETARNILTKSPGDEKALEALATILYLRGAYEKAYFYAQLLISKFPTNSSAYNVAAISKLKTSRGPEDLIEVEKLLENAFAGKGAEIAAGLNLGYLYLETGNSKKALGIFEETSRRCNECFQAILGAGIAARRSKNFKVSKKYLEDATDKNNPYAYYHFALWHLQSSKDYDSARKNLVKLNDIAKPGSLAQIKGSALFDQIVNVLQEKEN